jgi:plastocyanin
MKRYKLNLWGALAVIGFVLLGLRAEAATNVVEVRGPSSYVFVPNNLVVNVGDTVLWTNQSSAVHDVTQGTRAGGKDPNPYWAQALLTLANRRFSVTFSNVGAYPYICEQHVFITPQPPSNPTQTGLVTVVIANIAPTVAITSPVDVSRFTAPASFNITADASDSDGTVTNVQFFAGATLLGSDTAPPYSIDAGPLTNGVYQLTARVLDNLGGSSTSAVVNVVVNSTHSVTTSGTTFVPNALNITVGDTVVFNDLFGAHSVTGDSASEPFCGSAFPSSCQVTFDTVDTFAYHCIPHGSIGMTGTITVSSPVNFRPIAILTSPTNGSVFAAPATFNLTADASDFGGSVARVNFIRGGLTLISTDDTSPYSATANALPEGNYVLTARVTDNLNLAGTSAPVNITVVTPDDNLLSSPTSLPAGFQFNYTANPGLRYVVEGSANDASPTPFVPIATNVAGSDVVTFSDPAAVGRSNRAYRVFRQP